jgi:anaphase-promoting complex subunit 6
MVDREPENPISWYAVGVVSQWTQMAARETVLQVSDKITAYSTCARILSSSHFISRTAGDMIRSHLPLMFVGMEHILLSNYRLADEALDTAYSMCDEDPLSINMAYDHGECVMRRLCLLRNNKKI